MNNTKQSKETFSIIIPNKYLTDKEQMMLSLYTGALEADELLEMLSISQIALEKHL